MSATTEKAHYWEGTNGASRGGPLLGVCWFVGSFLAVAAVMGQSDYRVLYLMLGFRSMIALAGYLIMQVTSRLCAAFASLSPIFFASLEPSAF